VERLRSIAQSRTEPASRVERARILLAYREDPSFFCGRHSESEGLLRYAWLTTLNWVIGYGHHIERALGWTIGLVILGAIVLRISGEGPKHGLPVGLSYSFDMLLPVIKLRDAHYQIDLVGWPRYYFYAHKIAGFVLASFLVAGISGLTK
jgi:hypothetical protein